ISIVGLSAYAASKWQELEISDKIEWRLNRTRVSEGIDERSELFSMAMQMFRGYPFLGTGWGGFCRRADGTVESPHNELLKALSEGGLLSATVLFLALLIPYSAAFSKKRNRPELKRLFAILITFGVAEAFYSHLVRAGLGVSYAVALGYALIE